VRCPEVVGRLPELLNGTLAGPEREEIRSHLYGCPVCGLEWHETRLGAAVFASHPTSDVIVALAWDRLGSGDDAEVARQHVASCSECAEDVALARDSREGEELAPAAPVRSPARRVWRPVPAALAAGLTVLAFGGGVFWEQGRTRAGRLGPGPVASIASRAMATSDGEETETSLRARLARVDAPQPNLPILELLPGAMQNRDTARGGAELVLGRDDRFVALVLSVPAAGPLSSAELRDDNGVRLWQGSGLRPNPLGGYTLGVPTSLLPDGRVTVALAGPDRRPLATLHFRVRRAR